MATTFVKDNIVKINKSRLVGEAIDYIGTNGQILAKTNEGFFVKTNDNFLEILEIESNYKLRVGDKLGI